MPTLKNIQNPELTLSYFADNDELITDVLLRPRPISLIAMNVEKLMNMRKNKDILGIHNSIIYYPDGAPITWFTKGAYPRLPGVELWIELHRAAIKKNLNILFIGSQERVIKKTEQKLIDLGLAKNVKLIDGYRSNDVYMQEVKTLKPDIVFVAMGSPKQERFISELSTIHKNAIYMGVGGSLDVFSGFKDRSPYFLRRIGLEFLYRLYKEPKRILRQYVYINFVLLFLLGAFRVK